MPPLPGLDLKSSESVSSNPPAPSLLSDKSQGYMGHILQLTQSSYTQSVYPMCLSVYTVAKAEEKEFEGF